MAEIIVFFIITAYWLVNSIIIQLFLMILYVVFNSMLIYYMSQMSFVSYLMLFSVVSGLVAVMAFVMLSEPNSESSIIENKMISMLSIPLMLTISIFPTMEIVYSSPTLLVNQFTNFSSFTMDSYVHMFLFMALIMLMMLFVVDLILTTYGGSMLPMK